MVPDGRGKRLPARRICHALASADHELLEALQVVKPLAHPIRVQLDIPKVQNLQRRQRRCILRWPS